MVRAVASNYAALAAQVGWLIVLTPFLSRERGADELGAWTVAMSVAGYLRLLDIGVGPTFARFVAADVEGSRRSELLSAGFAVLAAVAAVAVLAGVGLAFVAPDVFASHSDVGLAVAVAVIGSALQVPLRIFSHLLYGLERLVERNAFTVVRLLASLAATIGGVLAGWSLAGYLSAAMGAELAVSALQAVWTLYATRTAIRLRSVRRPLLRELTRFGVATFGLQAATQIVYYSDALVIGAALGTRQAGVYAVAMRLVEGASLSMGQVADAFMPMLARMQADAREAGARQLALYGAPMLLVLASPVIAVLVALGGPLIDLWVGGGYSDATLPLALLAAGLAFNVPLRFPVLWALGAGRHHRIAAYALAEAVVNVALSIVLVGPLGLDGVALATLITLAISNGILIPRVLGAELGAPVRQWYAQPLARAAAATAPLAAGVLAIGAATRDRAPLTIGLTVGLAGVVLVAVAHVAVPRSDRRVLIAWLRRARQSA